ncbi:MAG: hypothetical protein JWP23_386 [Phenylobacterium sp.]|nr:hypothetical protein [Phenylobacterium sp.]
MARMIDPSALEGGDLVNWYQRSPAEVDAERAAARQEQYDAFVKSIGGASEFQGGSTAEPQGPTYDAAQRGEIGPSDGDAGLMEARYFPFVAPVMPPPSGLRVGPPLDALGAPPIGAPPSGFFGQHDYSTALGGYYTDLPSPLNFVTSTPAGWWEIGDGRRVQTDEVERIYAEQRRRLKGQDSTEPAARVRVVDNWKDGQIPRESQVQAGERELDPTCQPNGGWERDPNFKNYPALTKRYEAQVTRAPGLDYVVRNPGQRPVKFDGCAVWDPQHPLLEAKGPGYAPLLPKALEWGFHKQMFEKAVGQANRQADAAPGQRIEWHVAEPSAFGFFDRATKGLRPPIILGQTSPR